MSRVVKNVIVWVLVLVVILCIIAGFTFGLSSVSGVASAKSFSSSPSSNYVNGGVVRSNILKYSTPDSLSENLRINYSVNDFDDVPFGDTSFDDYLYATDVANITIGDDGVWNITSKDDGVFFYYLKTFPSADIINTAFTFTIALHVNSVASSFGEYDNSIGYVTSNPYSSSSYYQEVSYFNLSGYQANDVAIVSLDFTMPYKNIDLRAFKFELFCDAGGASYASPLWFKVESYSIDDAAGFTGYVEFDKDYNDGYDSGYNEGYNAGVADGTQSGYDEGYVDGYDEGYTNGLADEVYTASQAFKSSGYEYMNSLKAGTSTKFEGVKSIGSLVDGYEDVDIPLNGLYFAASNLIPDNSGGHLPLPSDWESLLDGTVYDTAYEIYAKSQYAMTFDNRVQQAQWLIDHPMDNLVLIPTDVVGGSSGSVYPIYFVMNDRSLLERFVSGAGAAYDLGYQGGYNEGYDAGDGAGYNRGYGVGFNDGQVDASSGNYTFLALIGSVLDAPISAFKGLLDFDLLGVNMSSFVLAIMSLCVIIVIIRVVLR